MPKAIGKLTGQRFGRLLVLGLSPKTKVASIFWDCLCVCGGFRTILAQSLKSGNTTSCGCYNRDRVRKHGRFGKPEYKTWQSMISRCTRVNTSGFERYGGRGIKVCDRWMKFENFLVDMGERPAGTTLDRIDNDGNYEPSNCRWATNAEQASNRNNTHLLTYQGETLWLSEWARRVSITPTGLKYRIKQGWTTGQVLGFESRPRKSHKQVLSR